MNPFPRGLYLVTPDWDDTEQLLRVSQQAMQTVLGGAAILQYRHKTATPTQRLAQATALLHLCRQMNIPFIINDHVDLCLQLDADGVHVGGQDLSVAQARQLLGPNKIIGASCYGSLELAQQAADSSADYLAFGGFYPSRVKQYAVTTPPERVAQAKRLFTQPIVVIGGMTPENAVPLVAQGADSVAAISSIYNAPDPSASASAMQFTNLFHPVQAL